ncbi:hypothetical protein PENANT_c031G05495 [Penicillium antarcticum]|uniref:VOC domain-containing protein n=1 Tax=Penicillium antarcticum TaxID=416450 RepID=A0A1V6PV72_9EURO|nr:uncharacterized protein N7508_005599 [Penicillium antarcticum]KAJ5306584.1 hypothetical protein N7508_005599 [Penicillium antarcticum]OQD80865.1 hypothetical protein PENANT_c031G05495 [Penicillium antarcticum]
MPVSHITLTVSHLPTSTSFFLSCLQPLGYQFIGRHDDYIGFGQKQGEPADFWMTEQKPGVPPGAVHVAFPAPSRDAVGSFFISALKAGGKIHGEPKERDSHTGYFSAAVIDFDGNSIEAVYRPTSSGSSVVSAASGPTMALLENKDSRSVVSKVSSKAPSVKAESVKAESIAPPRSEAHSRAVSKAPTAIERSAPTVVSRAQSHAPSQQQYAPSQQQYGLQTPPQTPPKTDDGSKAAKTIVGTLIGAAAGAAIAYAMVKGENSSNTEQQSPMQYVTNFPQLKAAPSQASHEEEAPAPSQFRALEAPPPRSEYGRSEYARSEYARSQYTAASAPRTTLTRSVTSKNPRASTIYEGTEFMHDDPGRRASEGSIYSIPEDLPFRAIEYPPPSNASQQRYPCNPSTFISSYANDKPRNNSSGSIHSSSTIKASQSNVQRRHSSDDRDEYSTHSSHHSHHSQQTVYRAASIKSASIAPSSHRGSPPSATGTAKEPSIAPSTRSARDIPLPQGSHTTTYSSPSMHSKEGGSTAKNSHVSARQIPLPQGSISTFYSSPSIASDTYHGAGGEVTRTADKTSYVSLSPRDIFLPESVIDVDVNSNVTPDDSISQVGGHSHGGRSRSRHSHHSQARSHRSRSRSHRSSHSRASKREPSVHSKAGSKVGSKAGSKSGSKFDEPVRPADSVSQVSRASQRTAKAPESRRGSQVV